MKGEIEELIEELGVQGSVNLLKSQTRSSVFNQLRQADVFLLPSITAADGDREGLPVSILEAQALGVPVVSTLHTGIPEGVRDGETGFLVQEGDVDALSDRLEVLLRDKALRTSMGERGRKFIRDHFSHESEMPKLERLMQGLVADCNGMSMVLPQRQQQIRERIGGMLGEITRQNDEVIRRKEKKIESQKKEIQSQRREIVARDLKIEQLSRRLERIYNTLSWRITEPLRRMRERIRKGKRGQLG
jgi:hypothetical protein